MRVVLISSTALVCAITSWPSVASDDTQSSATSSKVEPSDSSTELTWNDKSKHEVLRSRTTVDNEERLAGANMFDEAKIQRAASDTSYFEELLARWGRYRVTPEEALEKVKPVRADEHSVAEPDLQALMHVKNTEKYDGTIENVIRQALAKPHDEVWAFKFLKLYGYTPEDVLKVAVKDEALLEFHAKYLNWLQLHHPTPGFGSTLTPRQFLFERSRVEKAIEDREFAFRLFEKWENARIGKDEAFEQVKNIGLSEEDTAQLRTLYAMWKHEPPEPPEPRRKSWLRHFLERLLSFLSSLRPRSA